MKAIITLILIVFTAAQLYSQDVKYEKNKKDNITEVTFYYENGEVRQKGFYKKDKLHGQWISYDRNGNKKTIAYYNKGERTGRWIFWEDEKIIEVDYHKNSISEVKHYQLQLNPIKYDYNNR